MSLATNLIHSIPIDPLTGAISVPIYQTSTFIQESPGVNKGFDYARSGNPTRQALEDIIAKLEHGSTGVAFASGLAAIDAVVKLLKSGDEILAVDDIYRRAFRLFPHLYQKLGITVKYTDPTDPVNVIKHSRSNHTSGIDANKSYFKISDSPRSPKIANAITLASVTILLHHQL